MKAQDFKDFAALPDVLSEVQREVLMTPLIRKGSANKAIAFIETQFAGHSLLQALQVGTHQTLGVSQ